LKTKIVSSVTTWILKIRDCGLQIAHPQSFRCFTTLYLLIFLKLQPIRISSAEEKKVASEKIIDFQPDAKQTCVLTRNKSPTKEEIVLALTPFVRYETKTDEKGKTKQYVVRECPNKKYCKNEGGLIRFLNKSSYKNPHSHLRVCVAKVSTAVISHQYYTHDLYLYITFPTVRRGCIVRDL